MRKRLLMIAAIAGLMMVTEAATAQLVSSTAVRRQAPAPLLAAGIPAFVALGGAAAVGRFLRRRRANKDTMPAPSDTM